MLQNPKFCAASRIQFDVDGLKISLVLGANFVAVVPLQKNALIVFSLPDRQRLSTAVPQNLFSEETEFLGRMFHLAAPDNPVLKIPNFVAVHFKEDHVRQGFLDAANFDKLLAALLERLRPFVLLLYTTGVRTGEARKIQWSQVDFDEGVIRLSQTQTKNANARVLPLDDELAEMLKAERKKSGSVFPFTSFRKAWCNACVKVGLGTLDRTGVNKKLNGDYGKYGGLIPHDLRRSAVRDLIRAGVSQTVAMRISGHKTDAIFRRYNITEDKDLLAAKDSLRAYRSRIGQVQKSEQASREKAS